MKNCIILAASTVLGYHTMFELFRTKQLIIGHSGHKERIGHNFFYKDKNIFKTTLWLTTLNVYGYDKDFVLKNRYEPAKFQHYDNYPDIIEVKKCADIPADYDGVMGVPITFLGKYCPAQFEIIGISNHYEMAGIPYKDGNCYCEISGARKYVRIFIRKRKNKKIKNKRLNG